MFSNLAGETFLAPLPYLISPGSGVTFSHHPKSTSNLCHNISYLWSTYSEPGPVLRSLHTLSSLSFTKVANLR